MGLAHCILTISRKVSSKTKKNVLTSKTKKDKNNESVLLFNVVEQCNGKLRSAQSDSTVHWFNPRLCRSILVQRWLRSRSVPSPTFFIRSERIPPLYQDLWTMLSRFSMRATSTSTEDSRLSSYTSQVQHGPLGNEINAQKASPALLSRVRRFYRYWHLSGQLSLELRVSVLVA